MSGGVIFFWTRSRSIIASFTHHESEAGPPLMRRSTYGGTMFSWSIFASSYPATLNFQVSRKFSSVPRGVEYEGL